MTAVMDPPIVRDPVVTPGNGGVAARRAVTRWGWRLFRREWRQQVLVLALIVVAVAAVFVGSATSSDSPAPHNAGFGTAHWGALIKGTPSHDLSVVSGLQHKVGTVDVIENQQVSLPGTLNTFTLRSQNPYGAYGTPMLQLLTGHYPSGAGQADVTQGVATAFHLHVGSTWHQDGLTLHIVGTVQNPQSLLDEFVLVPPGQLPLTNSTTVTALFDGSASVASSVGALSSSSANNSNIINPGTITITLATVGMLLIGLVAIAGFTVLAQRRLRSIGMLESLGATDANVKMVVRANGAAVGIVGALLGALLGFGLWAAYRPHLEQSSHHVIGLLQLPWPVVGISLGLAVLTPFLAASRPASTITKVPIVVALAGRPAPPKRVHRTAIPGIIACVIAFLLLGAAGAVGKNGGGAPYIIFGFVALIVGVVLLAPMFVSALGLIGRRAPLSTRIALRDLSRYQARSGSALGAVSVGVLIAVVVCVIASARYSNVLDYAGPNLTSNEVFVYYTPPGGTYVGPKGGDNNGPTNVPSAAQQTADAQTLARDLGSSSVLTLESPSANLTQARAGSNNWDGAIYVATPALLHQFGIANSQIQPNADVLTMRPGLSGYSDMQLLYGNNGGNGGQGGGPNDSTTFPCTAGSCVANPVIQQVSQLPSGTEAPNTVLTEHAMNTLHLQNSVSIGGWLITTPNALSAAQISQAQQIAAADNIAVDTKNDEPNSWQVVDWATAVGIGLALAILAMTIGLIRSETASDLRTLAATGASSWRRRSITAATAGGLAFVGAILGTAAGYLASAAYFRTSDLAGQTMWQDLSAVPVSNLLFILLGMPLIAMIGGWILAGRQPPLVSRQPIE
ncbi:MAG TPA: FtsX-like permease family protein [Acidimicrobiales bacterium]